MPGKHAPSSPTSFYLSLARWIAVAAGVAGVLVAIGLVIAGGGESGPTLAASRTPTAKVKVSKPATVTPASPTPARSAAPLRKPSETTVRVLNGTNRSGLARRVGDDLEEEGYDVLERANGPAGTDTTTIFYKRGWLPEARALQRKHPEMSKIAEARADYAAKAALTVLIGADYP